jgi:hypothetical protein
MFGGVEVILCQVRWYNIHKLWVGKGLEKTAYFKALFKYLLGEMRKTMKKDIW